MSLISPKDYIAAVVNNYVRLPGTPLRPSRADRRFAALLYARRVPLRVVYAAFVLAVARRELRPTDLPSHPAIRTLHFFEDVIDEVLTTHPAPGYVQHLADRIRPLVERKAGSGKAPTPPPY
jgi:hypothetical protein